MATVRYSVEGVPRQYLHAFMPMPGLTPAGSSSVSRFTHGGPVQVRAPRPVGSASLSNNPGWWPPSSVAPDYLILNQYVNDIAQLRPPVHYLPNAARHGIPRPIGSAAGHSPTAPGQVSPVKMRGRKIGGLRAMHWPRPIVRFPGLDGQYVD